MDRYTNAIAHFVLKYATEVLEDRWESMEHYITGTQYLGRYYKGVGGKSQSMAANIAKGI